METAAMAAGGRTVRPPEPFLGLSEGEPSLTPPPPEKHPQSPDDDDDDGAAPRVWEDDPV